MNKKSLRFYGVIFSLLIFLSACTEEEIIPTTDFKYQTIAFEYGNTKLLTPSITGQIAGQFESSNEAVIIDANTGVINLDTTLKNLNLAKGEKLNFEIKLVNAGTLIQTKTLKLYTFKSTNDIPGYLLDLTGFKLRKDGDDDDPPVIIDGND
ncbi:MAG: hypothetical protein KTR26_12115 [Flammeovirgaceae bacterium]|nr:hypothetical protein [Flammeovirgaceae bacterium]